MEESDTFGKKPEKKKKKKKEKRKDDGKRKSDNDEKVKSATHLDDAPVTTIEECEAHANLEATETIATAPCEALPNDGADIADANGTNPTESQYYPEGNDAEECRPGKDAEECRQGKDAFGADDGSLGMAAANNVATVIDIDCDEDAQEATGTHGDARDGADAAFRTNAEMDTGEQADVTAENDENDGVSKVNLPNFPPMDVSALDKESKPRLTFKRRRIVASTVKRDYEGGQEPSSCSTCGGCQSVKRIIEQARLDRRAYALETRLLRKEMHVLRDHMRMILQPIPHAYLQPFHDFPPVPPPLDGVNLPSSGSQKRPRSPEDDRRAGVHPKSGAKKWSEPERWRTTESKLDQELEAWWKDGTNPSGWETGAKETSGETWEEGAEAGGGGAGGGGGSNHDWWEESNSYWGGDWSGWGATRRVPAKWGGKRGRYPYHGSQMTKLPGKGDRKEKEWDGDNGKSSSHSKGKGRYSKDSKKEKDPSGSHNGEASRDKEE